jgi:hypothetical protein
LIVTQPLAGGNLLGGNERDPDEKLAMQPPEACVRMPPMSKIFLSYRRQDSRDITGRIYDRLLRHWEAERIFKDVDNIDPGEDYRDVIDREIAECALFLAVIGPHWLDVKKADGRRRLDDPHDMVRIELETALKRNQRVIPVIVGEGRMPEPEELPEPLKELADRHAFPVRPDPDFHRDMDRLVKLIERAMASREPLLAELIDPPAPQPVPPPLGLGSFLTEPPPPAAYDSSAHRSGDHSRHPTDSGVASLLYISATTLLVVCLIGVLFMGLMLIGSVVPSEGSSEPDFDLVMQGFCVLSILGNVFGLAGAGCIYARRLYWVAVAATCAMGVMTLLPCPIFNAPAAVFVLILLFRPGVREAFDAPA